MQNLVFQYVENKGISQDVNIRIIDLGFEVGELCKEILKEIISLLL